MNRFFEDVRYAVRQWLRRPGSTLVIVATLALGIGANAAIYSVVDAVLVRPLPYRQPERLMTVYSQFPTLGFDHFWISPPEYLELQRWSRAFSQVGAYRVRAANVSGGEEPQRVTAAVASASFFTALGVDALHGRPFGPQEDLPGAEPVVVLGHQLWRTSFGGDPSLVGRTVEVEGERRTVVGVMPPDFDIDDAGVQLWAPLALDPADPGGRGSHYLNLVGRLAEGASLAVARQELTGLLQRWQSELPDTHIPHPERHPLVIRPMKEVLVDGARQGVLLLAGAVGLVLLIACANVANLLLARAEARNREVAIRTALGAGGGQLMRQFLTESVLLALVGGGVGALVAFLGVNALLALNPEGVVRLEGVRLDGRILLFTLAVSLGTGFLFGLAPALNARARSFFTALKEGRRASAGPRRRAFRASLVVLEVALAVMLLVAASLLLRSFWNLQRVAPGFAADGVITFQLSLPPSTYPEAADVEGFYQRLLDEVRALPGVEAAAAMSGLPPVREVDANDTQFEGVPEPPEGPPQNVDYYQTATLGYFETLHIPVVRGRVFAATDVGGAPVAVVNQRLAEVFWPGQDPLGRRLRVCCGDDIPWMTVVGVVGDVKQGGLDRPAGTELYFFAAQAAADFGFAPRTRYLVARSRGNPLALAGPLRAAVNRLDPALPLARLQLMEEAVAGSLSSPRFLTLLVALFGALALLLATVGTYAVLSYSVEERQHEIGVRMALGAQAGLVLRLVLRQGMRLVAAGLLLGVAGAWVARRLLESVLFGVAPGDPGTFAAASSLLAAVALLACLLPARRATRVDPLHTLRSD